MFLWQPYFSYEFCLFLPKHYNDLMSCRTLKRQLTNYQASPNFTGYPGWWINKQFTPISWVWEIHPRFLTQICSNMRPHCWEVLLEIGCVFWAFKYNGKMEEVAWKGSILHFLLVLRFGWEGSDIYLVPSNHHGFHGFSLLVFEVYLPWN